MILAGNLVITELLINAYRLVHKLCTYAKLSARYKTFLSSPCLALTQSYIQITAYKTSQTLKDYHYIHVQEKKSCLDDASDVIHSWKCMTAT